ncbi:hypothetical protein LPJ81_003334 [Coemansia sp. IMI 209127]|nr:hypothetical protein LPJ81_003334 [Coemansia sp. IMI 209127]
MPMKSGRIQRYLGKAKESKMGDTVEQAAEQQADKLTMVFFNEGATVEERNKVEEAIISSGGEIKQRMENLGAISVKLGEVHSANTASLEKEHDAINFVEEDSTVTTQ